MSDDNQFGDDALEPGGFLDKPDPEDYPEWEDRFAGDDGENWEFAWDISQLDESWSDDQMDSLIDVIEAALEEGWTWEEIFDAMYEDFWDFWDEFYGEG